MGRSCHLLLPDSTVIMERQSVLGFRAPALIGYSAIRHLILQPGRDQSEKMCIWTVYGRHGCVWEGGAKAW